MRPLVALFFFLATLAIGSANAREDLVLRYLNAKYEKLPSWSGRITQETRSVALGTGRFQEGIMEFRSPNQFRFRLEGSEGSEFLSDGKTAWQLFPANQNRGLLVRRLKNMKGSELDRYLIFLRGLGNTPKQTLEKEYTIKTETPSPKSYVVSLSPKAPSEFSEIRIEFQDSKKAFDRVILKDEIGGETIITLLSQKVVKKFSPDHFQPKIPKNTPIEDI